MSALCRPGSSKASWMTASSASPLSASMDPLGCPYRIESRGFEIATLRARICSTPALGRLSGSFPGGTFLRGHRSSHRLANLGRARDLHRHLRLAVPAGYFQAHLARCGGGGKRVADLEAAA